MDFYRVAGGQIAENWVMLDYMDLFRQMGVIYRARLARLRPLWVGPGRCGSGAARLQGDMPSPMRDAAMDDQASR